MKFWNFNEHVKIALPTKFWAYIFKNSKVTGPWKYLLWRHTDVIEALNLQIYNFLKNLHQNTPASQICTFYLEKYQSYKACHVFHYDVIMTSYKSEFENK